MGTPRTNTGPHATGPLAAYGPGARGADDRPGSAAGAQPLWLSARRQLRRLGDPRFREGAGAHRAHTDRTGVGPAASPPPRSGRRLARPPPARARPPAAGLRPRAQSRGADLGLRQDEPA